MNKFRDQGGKKGPQSFKIKPEDDSGIPLARLPQGSKLYVTSSTLAIDFQERIHVPEFVLNLSKHKTNIPLLRFQFQQAAKWCRLPETHKAVLTILDSEL